MRGLLLQEINCLILIIWVQYPNENNPAVKRINRQFMKTKNGTQFSVLCFRVFTKIDILNIRLTLFL